jgi:hypothetical protein
MVEKPERATRLVQTELHESLLRRAWPREIGVPAESGATPG